MQMLENIIKSGAKLTPMMEQYSAIKKNYPEVLLLFRLGDFYEMFFEDALIAAKVLNIALTHKGKISDITVPMAGIPHHAANNYIDKLTDAGYKAAICEQMENPGDSPGIVRREVVQVVSPSMPFNLDRDDFKKSLNTNRFILSATFDEKLKLFYLVFIDYTTGEFFAHVLNEVNDLVEKIKIHKPRELICFMGQWRNFPQLAQLFRDEKIVTTHLSADYFQAKNNEIYIKKLIPYFDHDEIIKMHEGILAPLAAIGYYISSTQNLEKLSHLHPFRIENDSDKLKVTLNTLKGLEIFPRDTNQYKDSLLGFCDKTLSALGTRRLKHLFLNPLRNAKAIRERQNFIEFFMQKQDLLQAVRDQLKDLKDLERTKTKISSHKCYAYDLINLSESIKIYFAINDLFKNKNMPPANVIHPLNASEAEAIKVIGETIDNAINSELGASFDKGNLIKPGFNKKRDKLEKLAKNSEDGLTILEDKYKDLSGINNLKIKFYNVSGFFIEVSKSHINKVPKSFERRQTLVNAERFTTTELMNYEKEVLTAKDQLRSIEEEIFNQIKISVNEKLHIVQLIAFYLGNLDAFTALSLVAYTEKFSRPVINEKTKILSVKNGFHPLIKSVLFDQFTTHNLLLNQENHFALITGPNMAGKTTVMREMSLIQFLAQIGSFVPATHAEVDLKDFIFSRLGAGDNIQQGQSTFMVEMSEMAEIVRHSTEKSLIILDEVGRGTSTYDGLSIAWSLTEYFVKKNKAICLFATHYHELIEVVDKFHKQNEGGINFTVETMVEKENVQFLYKLIEGGAKQSYGIYVAKLAGLPAPILKRSEAILKVLEKNHQSAKPGPIKANPVSKSQLSIFPDTNDEESQVTTGVPEYFRAIENELKSININTLTPLEALKKLYDLQQKIHLQ